MKALTNDQIDTVIDALSDMGCSEVFDKLWENRSSYYDSICAWNTETESIEFLTIPRGNSFHYSWHDSHVILITFDACPVDDGLDWRTDLFSEEEVKEIDECCDGDFQQWMTGRPSEDTFNERCRNGAYFYFQQDWNKMLNDLRETL